jgi:outer membrane protein assembly factor BamB
MRPRVNGIARATLVLVATGMAAFALHPCSAAHAASAASQDDATVPSAPAAWSARLDGPVEWQRVAPLGQLLVKTSRSLSGLDPVQGRVLWSQTTLGPLTQDRFEVIEGTSLVVLSDGQAKPRVVVLDSVDGHVVFDSRAAGVEQVLSRHYLPQSRALVLFGFSTGDPATTMFLADVDSGTLRWRNNKLVESQGKMARFAAFLQKAMNASGIVGEPVEITPDTFVFASNNETFAVRTKTGDIVWRAPNPHDTKAARFDVSDKAPGLVFVGSETAMSTTSSFGSGTHVSTGSTGSEEILYTETMARRIADGTAVWPKGVRVKGGLNDVIFTDQGIILSPRTTGKGKILLCDYKTGESTWGRKGKGIEIQGGIINHDWTPAGLVLTTGYDSAWTNKGTEYFLTLIDPKTGDLRFEEPLRLRGRITSTKMIPAGLLFTTTSEVNVLDLKSGRPLLGDGVRSDDSLVATSSGRTLFAYAAKEGTLHRLDLDRGTLETLSKEAATLEEDEAPMGIEVDGDRITVISSQNVIAWKTDGTLLFHAYHRSPGLPGLQQALLRAEQFRTGMAAAAAGMGAVTFASASQASSPGSVERAVTATAATSYAEGSAQLAHLSARYGEAARTRFKATAVSPDFVFMMVKRSQGNVGLARVSKETGRMDAVIDLGRDREPVYDVDAIANLIYYRSAPDTVSAYRF